MNKVRLNYVLNQVIARCGICKLSHVRPCPYSHLGISYYLTNDSNNILLFSLKPPKWDYSHPFVCDKFFSKTK